MSAFARKVEEAYKSRQVRTVTVPEWNATLFIGPLTLAQLQAINSDEDPFLRVLRQVTVRAKKEDGSPYFDRDDIDTLTTNGVGPFGPEVVFRVSAEIRAGDLGEGETEKKA